MEGIIRLIPKVDQFVLSNSGKRNLLNFCILFFMLQSAGYSQLDTIHYFPPIHSKLNDQIQEQYVYLSTPEETPFTVTIVNGAGEFIASAEISNGSPETVFIGSGQFPGTPIAVPKDSVFLKLEGSGMIASAPYDFYCNVRIKATNHATSVACKGRAGLGMEFYAGSMPQAISAPSRNFVTSIMATEDGTLVTVEGYNPGVYFETDGAPVTPDAMAFFLNAGESYVLTGYTTTTLENLDGFIGARITANKNIAVNTGNYLGSISAEGAQDAGLVQIVPTELIGTDHVLVAGAGGPVLERPLVVATEDGTEIFINDILDPITTINEGEYFLVPESYYSGALHQNMAVKTSNPAYVYQATAASTFSATSEFNYIPPLACYLTNFIDAIPEIDRIGPYVFDGVLYIITKTGSEVTVNDEIIGGFDGPEPAIGMPDWETYKLNMLGDVKIESTGPMTAGFISISGYAGAGAYYAGFNFDFQVDGGPDLDVCIGDEIVLVGEGAGLGGTYIWDGGIEDGVPFVPTETTTYTLTGSTDEGCEDEDIVVVTVFELPESNAGLDIEVCDTSSTTLNGNIPMLTGTGTWTLAAGPSIPFIEEPTEPETIVTGLIEGMYQFVWSVTNGPCSASTDTVNVFVYDLPISIAGADILLCNQTETMLNGNLLEGSAEGEWIFSEGPSIPEIEDINNPNTLISGLSEGIYSFIWEVSNGSCEPSFDTVIIYNYDSPLAFAGEDQEFCGASPITLNGNEPGETNEGSWTMIAGSGEPILSDPNDPNATVTDLLEGLYTFVWTVENEACGGVSDTVDIYVYEPSVSDAGPDKILCEEFETDLEAVPLAGLSEGTWSFGDGPTVPEFEDINDPNTQISDLEFGEYLLYWTVNNGICPSAIDSVMISVNPIPVIDISTSIDSGCAPLKVTLSNFSSPTGEYCFWDFGDGSTEVACGDLFHEFGPGEFDITLTVTANGCTSTKVFNDRIKVKAIPIAMFTPNPNEINLTNTTVIFSNQSLYGESYIWDFDDGSPYDYSFEPSHVFPNATNGEYDVMLIALNEFGCMDTAFQKVVFEELMIFYIPNAFTPDGFGPNEIFQPIITSRIDEDYYLFRIFDRWGEIIFETTDIHEGWDGTYLGQKVEPGVFVWRMEFNDTKTDLRYAHDGHVTLIR